MTESEIARGNRESVKSGCSFCATISAGGSVDAWDRPLFATSHFVVVPSLGALVEGWLLIVPTAHYVSNGALPRELLDELSCLKSRVRSIVGQIYGQAIVFEHGPAQEGRPVGCGTDHAHLHVVPLEFDLAAAVTPILPEGTMWHHGGLESCRAAFRRNLDYLYLEQRPDGGLVATNPRFGSQLFRRAIAAELGVASEFDWRAHRQLVNVASTIEKVRAFSETVSSGELQAIYA